MYDLCYFAKAPHICADDFRNRPKNEIINLNFVISISEPEMFTKPLTGTPVDMYSVVTMSNNDKYYIRVENLKSLLKALKAKAA